MKKLAGITGIICASSIMVLGLSSQALAEECITAVKKMTEDAQNIRLKALDMGWQVGKTTSLSAASLVSGKATLYPKDDVEICLKEEEGKLLARVQSKAKDAGQAEWHNIYGTKKEKAAPAQ
jgi:hypothetical protein